MNCSPLICNINPTKHYKCKAGTRWTTRTAHLLGCPNHPQTPWQTEDRTLLPIFQVQVWAAGVWCNKACHRHRRRILLLPPSIRMEQHSSGTRSLHLECKACLPKPVNSYGADCTCRGEDSSRAVPSSIKFILLQASWRQAAHQGRMTPLPDAKHRMFGKATHQCHAGADDAAQVARRWIASISCRRRDRQA